MEGRTKSGGGGSSSSSSPSLTSQLFGSTHIPSSSSSSSSSSIFGSIFPPPSKDTVAGGSWNNTTSKPGDVDRNREEQEKLGSVYPEQRVQPCHLSSSIYYGGPDVYIQPQNSSVNSTIKKDGGEDDSGSASRGNWWQGSLYY